MRKQVLFIELTLGGHRISMLRCLVEYAQGKGLDVAVATLDRTIEQGGFSDFSVPIFPIVGVKKRKYRGGSILGSLIDQINIYTSIKRFLRSTKPETIVVLPTLQACGAIPLSFSFSGFCRPWIGLLMSPAPHLEGFGIHTHHSRIELFIQKIAYKRLVKSQKCLRLGCFDPYFVEWMKNEKVVYCPDPVELVGAYTGIAKDIAELSAIKKPIILVIGTVDKRKKISELAAALNELPEEPFHLVVAGKLKVEDESSIYSSQFLELESSGDVTTIFRWLTDVEIDYLFHVASIVWSGNVRRYGSSGAVVQAGMHRKPVITMIGSMMGNWLKDSGGGPSIDMTDHRILKQELLRLLNSDYASSLGENNYRLFRDNNKEKFASDLLDPLLH